MWESITLLFRNYMGTGLIVVWFIVCLVYLFLEEKDKGRRVLFLYVPAVLFLLFFNPLFMKVVYGVIGSEIYYRIIWLMPITIVIAYTIVMVFQKLQGKKAFGFLTVAAILTMLSGSCIYQNAFFTRAENPEHMPQAVINICDAIEVEGREVMAAFPQEMLSYVRQYSPLVCMPYGREVLVPVWGYYSEFYEVMEADVADVERLTELAKQYRCHFVIMRESKECDGRFEDYGFVEKLRTDGYIVYQDPTVYIGL